MDILKYIYAAAMMLLLTGCYTEFEPEIKDKPVLCMNTLIDAGEPFRVSLTHTFLYTDTNRADVTVKDAVVKLYVNGSYKEDLQYREEYSINYYGEEVVNRGYYSTYEPKEEDVIRLEASHPTYGDATAEVTVPKHVDIESIQWNAPEEEIIDFYNTIQGYVHGKVFSMNMFVNFTDPAADTNYYKVKWDAIKPDSFYEEDDDSDEEDSDTDAEPFINTIFWLSGFDNEVDPIFSEFIDAFENIMGSDSFGYTLFSDRTISGQRYPLHLSFSNVRYSRSCNEDFNDPDIYDAKIVITLQSISESFYKWYLYCWTKDDSFMGSLSDIGLTDNYTAYSNVSTHAGVVAATASYDYILDISDFIRDGIIK
jgi:hypothetical protein